MKTLIFAAVVWLAPSIILSVDIARREVLRIRGGRHG